MASRFLALVLVLFAATSLADDPQLEYRTVTIFNQHLYLGTFARPRALAYDRKHSELWLADTGNGAVSVFRPDGAELYSFTSRQYLHDPVRVAIAPNGGIAVVEGDRSRIRLFNYRGVYKGDITLNGIDGTPLIGALTYDADGKLYIADNHSGQIFIYGPDGRKRQQFGSRGTDEGQLQSVCAIAIGSDGAIYVADQQAIAVQVFDSQGNFVRGWGRHEMGAANFSLPSGIALDSQGHVLVTDELRHQVKIFTPAGVLLHQFGGLGEGAGQLSFPSDVAVDDKDRIYVVERGNARVQVFEPVR